MPRAVMRPMRLAACRRPSWSSSLTIQGFVTMFPGWPRMAAVVYVAIEPSKLILAGILAARWRTTPWIWRLVLIAIIVNAMAISAVGAFDKLTTMHLGDPGAVTADIEKRETEIAILVQNQQAVPTSTGASARSMRPSRRPRRWRCSPCHSRRRRRGRRATCPGRSNQTPPSRRYGVRQVARAAYIDRTAYR